MQRIERYGVIALVFLLVTIVAVSLWGEQKQGGGVLQILRRDSKSAQVDRIVADATPAQLPPSRPAVTRDAFGRTLPLAPEPREGDLPPARTAPLAPYRDVLRVDPLGSDDPVVDLEPVPGLAELPALPEPEPEPEPPLERAPLERPPPQRTPPAPPAATSRDYTVRPGDTLSEIASRELGTVRRMDEIEALNADLDPDRLLAGTVIRLPARTEPRTEPRTELPASPRIDPAPAPAASSTRRYTVQEGETLLEIASRELGTVRRMDEIVALNTGLDPDRVMAGQVLTLPAATDGAPRRSAPAQRPAPSAATRRYTVAEGDTLTRIAARELGSSAQMDEIVALNTGLDPDHLLVGQVLLLPAETAPTASRVAAAAPSRSKVR